MGPGNSGRSAGGPSQSGKQIPIDDQSPAFADSSGSFDLMTDEEQAFTKLKDSVSIQIFKIQSNVQGIARLVDKLGTPQDSDNVRTSL